MIKGKTDSGFAFAVDENVLRSKRFAKLSAKLVRASKKMDDPAAKVEAMVTEDDLEVLLLGEDGQEALIAHMDAISKTGMASSDDVAAEVNEIVQIISEKVPEVKNS